MSQFASGVAVAVGTRTFRPSLFLLGLLTALLATMPGCGSSKPIHTGSGNFSAVVFTGDSLTAGFQNGSLLDTQQPNGYAALIAKQANFSITLPLISPPGAPPVLQLVSVGPPPVIQQAAGITGVRDHPDQQPTDLAVPGHTLYDLIFKGPTLIPTSDEDIITDLVLGLPAGNTNPQLQEAINLKPSMLFVWIGNNDALVADTTGMPSSMTSLNAFTIDFTKLMTALQSQTEATLVVANIPDVTQIPYLTPATTVIAEAAAQSGLSTAQISTVLGISAGDFVNATGLAEVQTDLQNISAGKGTTPLSDGGVLSATEVTQVQAQIAAYNDVIAKQVAAANGILVDINGLYKSLQPGITINGYTATTGFLGGLFSLDGTHPTNTGYALIANKFIDTMNSGLGTSITDVNVGTVAANDPLFGPNIRPGAGTRQMHISLAAAQRTDQLLRRH